MHRTPNRISFELGVAGAKVEVAIETTEPLGPDAVTLVLADAAQLAQTVCHHAPPRPAGERAPALARYRDAFSETT